LKRQVSKTPLASQHVAISAIGEVTRLEARTVKRKLAPIFAADVEGYSPMG
jgi:hypothetical protein